jgi:hypothetical protein
MTLAPIVLFVYNRPEETKQTIAALAKNDLAAASELFIFCDGAKGETDKKSVAEVRNIVRSLTGFKNIVIIERDKNYGLAQSVISGVTEIVNKYGKVIVLEDDLLTSPQFLTFINDGLEIYQTEPQVGIIHAHIYNIKNLPELFFISKIGCWGWGTWARAWNKVSFDGQELLDKIKADKTERLFDVDNSYPYLKMLENQIAGKNSSWAIRMYASFFTQGMLALNPGRSLVEHIGYRGTHYGIGFKTEMDGIITNEPISCRFLELKNNPEALMKMADFYRQELKFKLKVFIFKAWNKIVKKIL